MEYGKNAKVGNIIVFSREGAERAYKIFCEIFNKEMTLEASAIQSDVMLDMFALGFTPEEVEALELSAM